MRFSQEQFIGFVLKLSPERRKVLELLGEEGITNQEIADRLDKSFGTVRCQIRELLAVAQESNLPINSRLQLALFYRDFKDLYQATK